MIDSNGFLVNDGLYMILEAAGRISIVAIFGLATCIIWQILKH